MEIVAQVFGVLAFIASVASFQFKTYRQILYVQTLCAGLFVIHFYLLYRSGQADALTGTALNGVCMVRDILLLLTEKRRTPKRTAVLAGVFSILITVIGILTAKSWTSVLFIIAMILNTVALSIPDPNTVRLIIMISAPFACAYDLFNRSIGGTVNEVVSFFSALTALLRNRKKAV